MLLSSLLPRLSAKFPSGVPPILSIQSALESLWSAGHDPSSAKHHGRRIANTKRWIGAVEVWSYLTYLGIDSVLVQFIGGIENRALLGEFCWRYFSRSVGDDAGCDSSMHGEEDGLEETDTVRVCGEMGKVVRGARAAETEAAECEHPLARPKVTASDYARRILDQMSARRDADASSSPQHLRGEDAVFGEDAQHARAGEVDDCAVPPLYLQWKGHSVTVVGVTRIASPTKEQACCPYRLLIFCPQKKGPDMKRGLAARYEAGTRGWGPTGPRPRRGAGPGRDADVDLTGHLEIPCVKLLGKDCQILLCTGRELSEDEIGRRKRCSLDAGYLDAKAGGAGDGGAKPSPPPPGVRRSPRLGR